MVVGGFDITNLYIRARQKEPTEFEKDAFRTIRFAPGIKAIVGRLKGETTTTVQSILFDKKKYTEEQAKEWLVKHKEKFSQAMDFENQKIGLFADGSSPMNTDVLTTEEMQTLMGLLYKLMDQLAEDMTGEDVPAVPMDSDAFNSSLLSKYLRVV